MSCHAPNQDSTFVELLKAALQVTTLSSLQCGQETNTIVTIIDAVTMTTTITIQLRRGQAQVRAFGRQEHQHILSNAKIASDHLVPLSKAVIAELKVMLS